MKLTIIRLQHFSDQDRIDLGKIWPSQDLSTLTLDENHRLYAARFNERLLGAVRVILRGVEGELSDLCVREVTRRPTTRKPHFVWRPRLAVLSCKTVECKVQIGRASCRERV